MADIQLALSTSKPPGVAIISVDGAPPVHVVISADHTQSMVQPVNVFGTFADVSHNLVVTSKHGDTVIQGAEYKGKFVPVSDTVAEGASFTIAIPAPTSKHPPKSPDGTTITVVGGPPINDGNGNTFNLVSSSSRGNEISVNGVPDASSANVALLLWFGGALYQKNTAGDWWTEPLTGGPGTYTTDPRATVPPVTPPGPPINPGPITYTKPSDAGDLVYDIIPGTGSNGWSTLINNLASQGSATGLSTKIPCPGSHLDWEYGNPEREYYLNPSESGGAFPSPFSIGPNGEMVITCKNIPTPNGGQDYLSGCLTTAGFDGTLFAGGYGFYVSRMAWDLGPGFWPAFWFLSLNDNFQYNLEIDVFENWQNMVGNPHCGMANSGDNGTFFNVPNPGSPHDFGVDYRADFVTFYLDGAQVYKMPTPSNSQGKTIFPIWNIAVGRDNTWAGSPPAVPGSSMAMHIYGFAAFK